MHPCEYENLTLCLLRSRFVFQRKLQRCIKHIQDKHGVSVDSEPTDDGSFDAPRVITDMDALTSSPFYPPGVDDCSKESGINGDASESFDATSAKMEIETQSPDQFPADIVATGDVPSEDELFFFSKADYRCVVDKCMLVGPHYHCNRCPYVTRQVFTLLLATNFTNITLRQI